MAGITMYDTAFNNQFPAGGAAYAGYVDGGVGNQPNYAYIVSAFPRAQHLSIALSASYNADALDVEAGAAAAADVPNWHARQVARGIRRPVIYASASTMNDSVLPALSRAGIARASTRLWTAHYASEHICGPGSCGALSVSADGTQWTSNARGLVLDQSLLLANFFTTPATPQPIATEAELQSGQLNNGHGVFTVIPVPEGTAHHIAFGLDNHAQNVPAASLRVAIFDTTWRVHPDIVLDGNKGLGVLTFSNAAKTGVISVRRNDTGNAAIGYVIY